MGPRLGSAEAGADARQEVVSAGGCAGVGAGIGAGGGAGAKAEAGKLSQAAAGGVGDWRRQQQRRREAREGKEEEQHRAGGGSRHREQRGGARLAWRHFFSFRLVGGRWRVLLRVGWRISDWRVVRATEKERRLGTAAS